MLTTPTRLASLVAFRRSLVFALVLGATCSALPMTRVPGPESALACALVLAPWAAVVGARLALASRRRRTAYLLAEAIVAGLSLAFVCMAVVALGTLWSERCDAWSGLVFVALGPCISLPLAAIAGACVGSLGLAPRTATALALALPLGDVVRTLYQFVETPGIYAFGHFYGYFSGTLYDRHAEIPAAYLRHRLLSVALGAVLSFACVALRSRTNNRWHFAMAARAPSAALAAIALSAITVLAGLHSVAFGFHSDAAFIESALGSVIRTPRCRAVLPRELDIHEAMRLAEDCELRISQIETRLGVHEKGPITAYFFRSIEEKRALMGAYRVYIAKPWRREIYVQLAGFPHPVLGHELAHIVARNASDGVFGVPGRFRGLIPEPTLVEGTAVALDPGVSDELPPHDWAAAAHALHVAPALSELLGPRFLGANQALAYTLAGSFLSFVRERYGAEALRRVYRSGDYSAALGKSLDVLEAEWVAFLAQRPASPQALALAQSRFARPGVLSQVCPHDVEAAENELGAATQSGDLARIVVRAQRVLAIDRTDHAARIALVGALALAGEEVAAERELHTLQSELAAPLSTVTRARATLADAALARGDATRAAAIYRALIEQPDSEGEQRQREVRLLAADAPSYERALLAGVLVGSPGRPLDPRATMHFIHRLGETRRDGLAAYLEARQLLQSDRADLAFALTRESLARGLPTARLRSEAQRMRAATAFVVGDLDESEATFRALMTPGNPAFLAREAADYLARIALRRSEL